MTEARICALETIIAQQSRDLRSLAARLNSERDHAEVLRGVVLTLMEKASEAQVRARLDVLCGKAALKGTTPEVAVECAVDRCHSPPVDRS